MRGGIYRKVPAMAGGSLTVTVDTYEQLEVVTQNLLYWASTGSTGGVAAQFQIVTSTLGGQTVIVVPEQIFAGKGTMVFVPNGPDILAGYVPGTSIVVSGGNGNINSNFNVNTPQGAGNGPGVSSVVTNVGGNKRAITAVVDNSVAQNMDISWGDGTSTLNQVPGASLNHTYPASDGVIYRVTVSFTANANIRGTTIVKLP